MIYTGGSKKCLTENYPCIQSIPTNSWLMSQCCSEYRCMNIGDAKFACINRETGKNFR
jgi:hypothetical protein